MKILRRRQFGDPILRQKALMLTLPEMQSEEIQTLIKDMQHTLARYKLGVALAAPQVGKGVAVVVIAVRPMLHRHKVEPFDLVMINPQILQTFDQTKQMYEGCISSGAGGRAGIFAKVPRPTRLKVRYYDPEGQWHEQEFTDLKAQIIQHEVDHLNGVLFVDRVKDTSSYMTYSEYIKRAKAYLKQQ